MARVPPRLREAFASLRRPSFNLPKADRQEGSFIIWSSRSKSLPGAGVTVCQPGDTQDTMRGKGFPKEVYIIIQ